MGNRVLNASMLFASQRMNFSTHDLHHPQSKLRFTNGLYTIYRCQDETLKLGETKKMMERIGYGGFIAIIYNVIFGATWWSPVYVFLGLSPLYYVTGNVGMNAALAIEKICLMHNGTQIQVSTVGGGKRVLDIS